MLPFCSNYATLTGHASACNPGSQGVLPINLCEQLCGQALLAPGVAGVNGCVVQEGPEDAGELICFNPGSCSGASGRRPEGLATEAIYAPHVVAGFLAETAYLEAASVEAFERLARELKAHGAPSRLWVAAKRAARDEVRHARVMKALAEREGARVPECRVGARRVRSLVEIAVENAVEGCVRETLGAAVAMIQAERAADPKVRSAMKRIARDETRHAELSWAVATWLEPQLDAAARRRVRKARANAVASLMSDAAREPDASLVERLGVPAASRARAVLAELKTTLWSEPMAA
jgi:hypothetical protein